MGRLWRQPEDPPLTAMTAVIGKNGVGKSALFDAFGFLADALKLGVEEACDVRGDGAASGEYEAREKQAPSNSRCITGNTETPGPLPTRSHIEEDASNRPYVSEEHMQEDHRDRLMQTFFFFSLTAGRGVEGKPGSRTSR